MTCPVCDDTKEVVLKEATVSSVFYGTDVTVYNLPVPCPVCRPEAHKKPPAAVDTAGGGEE